MPYDSKAVANYFLDLADRSGKRLDPMQIQKLVYFAHAWNLAVTGEPLIDDTVEAWRYGPVIPALYHEFKSFGMHPITRKASNLKVVQREKWEYVFDEPKINESDTSSTTREVLDMVWNAYGNLTGIQLSNLTHEPGSPWRLAWEQSQGKKSVDIPDHLIREYFKASLDAA